MSETLKIGTSLVPSFLHAAEGARLGVAARIAIGLGVSEALDCGRCLSLYTTMALAAGFDEARIVQARQGCAPQSLLEDALLRFALEVLRSRGRPSEASLAAARASGLDDAVLVETVAVVARKAFVVCLKIHGAWPRSPFEEDKDGTAA